jgi:type I restriction enzyme, S subunit
MSTDLLFEHFATLATAPDGIARLRELILQLAVQGKLGTQDAGDEPASVLAKKLQLERERQIKEKIIREEDLSGPVKDAEQRFEIPKNWEWIRFGDEIFVIRGGSPRPKGDSRYFSSTPTKHHWIKISDIRKYSDGIHLSNTEEYLTEEGVKHSVPVRKGTLVLTNSATIGVPIFLDIDGCIHDGYLAFPFLKDTLIDSKFLFYFFKSLKSYLETIAPGGGQLNLNRSIVKNLAFALPPLAEQHRIVTKIDRLMALCDELEARQQKERAGCLMLGTASLAGLQNAESMEELERQWAQVCDAFDLILDCPENVAVLRQTILQLAVRGRLVRQEPGDEPASILLEAIRKEKDRLIKDGKIQKEKPLKFVNGDDVPFKIPNEWLWTYFGQITFNRDGARIPIEKAERATRHGAYDYYGASGVIDTIDDYLFDKPLLLIGEDGANLVNRSTPIAFIAHGKYWVNNHAHVLDGISFEFLRYLEVYINSIDLRPYLTGMAQPKMNQAKMNSIPVPLPPLAEQHRIVAKVDALMAFCDALEARLKVRARVQGKMADAIISNIPL